MQTRATPRSDQPVYMVVADRVAALIASGAIAPGARAPSVRTLARDLGVAITTVVKAYDLLEARDLIQARPQSGYFVRNSAGPTPARPMPASRVGSTPKIVKISDMVLGVMEAARDRAKVPFGMAVADRTLLPGSAINRAIVRAIRSSPDDAHDYLFPPGHKRLRAQIARRMLAARISATPEDITITAGGLEAISVALRCVTQPGDAVVVQAPCFFGLLQALESLHLRAILVPDNAVNGPAPDAIIHAVRSHRAACVLLMPTYSNPMGSTMPIEAKRSLVAALDRLDVPLVEDDVWGELPHRGPRPPACKAFDTNGNVLYASSVSKWLSPGLRIGWVHAGRFGHAAILNQFASSVSAPSASQLAVADLLASSGFERRIRAIRSHIGERTQWLAAEVIRCFPAGTSVSRPEGGYVLWVQMPRGIDAMALFARALDKGITVAPGPMFSPRGEHFAGCFRMNAAIPDAQPVRDAVNALGRIAESLAR